MLIRSGVAGPDAVRIADESPKITAPEYDLRKTLWEDEDHRATNRRFLDDGPARGDLPPDRELIDATATEFDRLQRNLFLRTGDGEVSRQIAVGRIRGDIAAGTVTVPAKPDEPVRRDKLLRPEDRPNGERMPVVYRPGWVYEDGRWRQETPEETRKPKEIPLAAKAPGGGEGDGAGAQGGGATKPKRPMKPIADGPGKPGPGAEAEPDGDNGAAGAGPNGEDSDSDDEDDLELPGVRGELQTGDRGGDQPAGGDIGPPTGEPVDRDEMFGRLGFDPDAFVGEKLNAIQDPQSALKGRALAHEASKKARDEALAGRFDIDSLRDGEADAFRHAYWSYRMTQELGPDAAKRIGDAHEITRVNPDDERLMDLFNNNVARGLATDPANQGRPADEVIFEAMDKGLLQTQPFKIK